MAIHLLYGTIAGFGIYLFAPLRNSPPPTLSGGRTRPPRNGQLPSPGGLVLAQTVLAFAKTNIPPLFLSYPSPPSFSCITFYAILLPLCHSSAHQKVF